MAIEMKPPQWVKLNGVETLVSLVQPKLGIRRYMGLQNHTLTLRGRDFQVNQKGIIQDQGKFYGKPWVLVNLWMNALNGDFGAIAYDQEGHLVHIVELAEWEADIVYSCDYLIVGLYLSSEGLKWYSSETGDEEDLANQIQGNA